MFISWWPSIHNIQNELQIYGFIKYVLARYVRNSFESLLHEHSLSYRTYTLIFD